MVNRKSYIKRKTADGYAELMVRYALSDGPKPFEEIKAFCKEREINRHELKAAREVLGVKTINTGETWLWELPKEGNTQWRKKRKK